MTPELELQRQLLIAAPRALPDVRLFRRNVMRVQIANGAQVKSGIKGQCDLHGYLKGCGLGFEIELKSHAGRLSKEQEAWRDWCAGWGVPWIVLAGSRLETSEQTVHRWLGEVAAWLFPRR